MIGSVQFTSAIRPSRFAPCRFGNNTAALANLQQLDQALVKATLAKLQTLRDAEGRPAANILFEACKTSHAVQPDDIFTIRLQTLELVNADGTIPPDVRIIVLGTAVGNNEKQRQFKMPVEHA